MNYKEWTQWLRRVQPLTRKAYHIGHLAFDRQYDAELDKIAKLFYALQELGFVVLHQKRIDHMIHYFITPCFRPLIEKIENDVKVKRVIDGVEHQVMVYGELQALRGSRGYEQGCIAEAEALAGLPFSEQRVT